MRSYTEERSILSENVHSRFKCKKCPSIDIWYAQSETFDSAYDIYRYRCAECNHNWRGVIEDD